jgi:hypothetical protein
MPWWMPYVVATASLFNARKVAKHSLGVAPNPTPQQTDHAKEDTSSFSAMRA